MVRAILRPFARITLCLTGLATALLPALAQAQEPVDAQGAQLAPPPLAPPPPATPPQDAPLPSVSAPSPVPLPPPPPAAPLPPPPPLSGESLGRTSTWKFDWGGYVHAAYRWVQEPQNYNLAGRNNGFQLEQARFIANVQWKNALAARVSLEGASEDRLNQSFPGGQLTTRLRDAYITWAPLRALRITIGQMVTPWDLDSMRSDSELPFVSRGVPIEGVQPTEGYTTRGLGSDRNLGLSIHSGFIALGGTTSLRYSLFVGNGNGQNQILNDSNLPAVFGRTEFAVWGKKGLPVDSVRPIYSVSDELAKPIISIGLAGQWNPRTAGNLPDLIRETDMGAAADLAASYFGFELQGGVVYVRTTHDTLAAIPDLERFGFWAHLRYSLPRIPVEITPGYRIASYSPRAHLGTAAATPADAEFDASFGLLYHTFGVTVRPTRTFPLHLGLNYTITTEQSPNVLDNDRFEADVVAIF